MTFSTKNPEFEAWWKRYWVGGTFHEGVRKELAYAAWKEATHVKQVSPPPGWTDPLPQDVVVARLYEEKEQYRNALGDLLAVIDKWRQQSPLYGAKKTS